MIFLLNLVKESEKKYNHKQNKKDLKIFDIFVELIKERSLIQPEKLNKLLNDL